MRKTGYYWVKNKVWVIRFWNGDIEAWFTILNEKVPDNYWEEIDERQIIRDA